MRFSDKHTVVLSILSLVLLIALVAYAGGLSPPSVRAEKTVSERFVRPSEFAEAASAVPGENDAYTSPDAGAPALEEPAAPDDLITTLLRQCVHTRSCPAWARATTHSGDAGFP